MQNPLPNDLSNTQSDSSEATNPRSPKAPHTSSPPERFDDNSAVPEPAATSKLIQALITDNSNEEMPLTPPCSNIAGRPSVASTDNEAPLTSDAFRSSLRRLAGLRMKALGYRMSAKEESRHIRNLNVQLIRELYKLYNLAAAMREKKDTLLGDMTEDSAEWEEYLVEIEECIEQTEEAGKRFERKQESIDVIEEQLQTEESDLYKSYVPQRLSSALVIEGEELEEDVLNHEVNLPKEIEKFLTLAKTPPGESTMSPAHLEEHNTRSSDEPRSPQLLFFEDEDLESYDVLEEEALDGDFEELFGSTSEEFSQFMGNDVTKLIEKAREAALVLDSGYSQNDLDRFFRWLAYGRPFTERLATSQHEPPLPRSVLSLFRTWIWHSLQLLSTGLPMPTDVSGGINLKDMNFAKIRAVLARSWLWDPDAHPRIGRSESQSATPGGDGNVENKPSTVEPATDSNLPYSRTRSNNATQTDITDQASHEISRRPAISEQSRSHIGREGFATIYPRRQPPDRRASS